MAKLEILDPQLTATSIDPCALPRIDVPGLYVHIPFCFHKCHYCDFYSITRQTPERMDRFVDLLMVELDRWLAAGAQRFVPRTVFFGGGTPSLLPFDSMKRLLSSLRSRLDFAQLREWTIEVNPATADLDYLKMLRSFGVDRISMGAQSFDERELATLERHHHPVDVERSVALCREAGFGRVNIDLIYAIPGQSLDSFMKSLERAIDLKLDHYSCYNLTYEPNTPMAVKQRLGRIQGVEESIEIQMLLATRKRLAEVGCPPYEISNYAAAGQECLHNLTYWRGESYLGIGPSAASHIEGVRFKNRSHLGEWERAIHAGELPATDQERLSQEQREGEYMMLGLRLAEGVSVARFESKFGRSLRKRFADQLAQLETLGFITVDSDVRLTDKGLPLADAVAAEFL
jgi:oxygen-independent coproporphyrinogen-3 oxidase